MEKNIANENVRLVDFDNINLYDQLIKYVESLKIELTNEQIKNYLESKEIENYPNIEERIENQRIMKSYFSSLDKNDELYEIFQNPNKMSILYYYFEPSVLNNYIKYASKLKNNILNIYNSICEMKSKYTKNNKINLKKVQINEEDYQKITSLINSLDSYINELEEIIETANNLETYLNFPIYEKLLYKFGVMTYESQRSIKQKTKVPNK